MGDVSLADYAPSLAQMGYDGIEVVGDLSHMPARELRSILDEHGLAVLSIVPTNDVDLAHPLPSQRQQAIDYYRELMDYCIDIDCSHILVREKAGRIRPIVGRTKEWQLYQQSISAITRTAMRMNMHISVLPVNRYEGFLVNTAQDALDTLANLDTFHADVALNTYHMNIEEEGMGAAIQAVGNRLGLFYAAENHRRALGNGQIDWIDVCTTLADQSFSGSIVVECQASGADPFLPVGRAPEWPSQVLDSAERSIEYLRVALAATTL